MVGLIDIDKLSDQAKIFQPKLIIAGGSAYPCDWDYTRYREIANQNGATLMMDMAHISDIVATKEMYDFEDRINFAVFPSCQGGPHNKAIAGVGAALAEHLPMTPAPALLSQSHPRTRAEPWPLPRLQPPLFRPQSREWPAHQHQRLHHLLLLLDTALHAHHRNPTGRNIQTPAFHLPL